MTVPPQYPQLPPPQVPKQHRGVSPVILITVLAVVFVGVIGGGYLVITKLFGDDKGSAVAGQLRGTFPAQPSAGWRLDVDQVFPGARFIRPDSSGSQYSAPGFIDLDRTLITVATASSSGGGASLVAVDTETGRVRWTAPLQERGSITCASGVIDGLLPCVVGGGAVQFFDTADGTVKRTLAAPKNTSVVEVHGSAVYTLGYQSISRGTTTNLTADWQQAYTSDYQCPDSGDSVSYGADDALVYFGPGNNVSVWSSTDGRRLTTAPLRSFTVFPGQGYAGEVCPDASSYRAVAADETGRVVRTDEGTAGYPTGVGASPAKAWLIAKGSNPPYIFVDRAYDFGTGKQRWTAHGGPGGDQLHTIIGDVVLGSPPDSRGGGSALSGYDLATGEYLWTNVEVGRYQLRTAISDGQRIIVESGGNDLVAVDLATGRPDWRLTVAERAGVAPAGQGFAVATGDHITYYPPTGGPSVAPGRHTAVDDGGGGGMITKCGRVPEMRPVSYRAESGALVVVMEVKATCPGGDIVSTDRLRVRIKDDTGSIAEGVFDFSGAPLVLTSDQPTTVELRFGEGGIWRHPNTLGKRSTGSTGPVTETDAAGNELVDCEDEGTSTGPTSTRSKPKAPQAPSATADGVLDCGSEQQALDALRIQVDTDRPVVQRDLADRWVAQLSSKQPGLVAPDVDGRGVTWTPCEILRQHLRLRLQYPEVRLVWSDEWRTFDLRGWWVTIAGATFPSPDDANGWCDQRGIAVDECYAKVISNSHDSSGTTKYRR